MAYLTIAQAAKEYKINLLDLVRAVQQGTIPSFCEDDAICLEPLDVEQWQKSSAKKSDVQRDLQADTQKGTPVPAAHPLDNSHTIDDLVNEFRAAKDGGDYQADFSELIGRLEQEYKGSTVDLTKDFLQRVYDPPPSRRRAYLRGTGFPEFVAHLLWIHQLGATDDEMRKILKLGSSLLRPSNKEKVTYLQSLGCTGKDIITIARRQQTLFNQTRENLERHILNLERMGTRKESLPKIIRRTPYALTGKDTTITSRFSLLADKVGITGQHHDRMMNSDVSMIGQRLEEKVQEHLDFFAEVGMAEDDVLKALKYYPRTFTFALETMIKPKVAYFTGLGFTGQELGTLFRRFPALFSYNIERMFVPHVEFLDKIGIPKKRRKDVLLEQPRLLVLRIDRILQPNYQRLRDLGMSYNRAAEICTLAPQWLYRSSLLETAIEYLKTLSLSDSQMSAIFRKNRAFYRYPRMLAEKATAMQEYLHSQGINIKNVGIKDPSIFSLNLESATEMVAFLQSIGATKEDVHRIISTFPQMLTLHLARNVQPKYNFLIDRGVENRTILQYPKVFSFSLEGRMQPRYLYLEQKGLYGEKPSRVLVGKDDGFAIKVAHTTVEEYELFLEKYRSSRK